MLALITNLVAAGITADQHRTATTTESGVPSIAFPLTLS